MLFFVSSHLKAKKQLAVSGILPREVLHMNFPILKHVNNLLIVALDYNEIILLVINTLKEMKY